MKKRITYFLIISMSAMMLTPRKANSGMLEGAIIGGAVGAIIGLIIESQKPKDQKPTAPLVDSTMAHPTDTTSKSNNPSK